MAQFKGEVLIPVVGSVRFCNQEPVKVFVKCVILLLKKSFIFYASILFIVI